MFKTKTKTKTLNSSLSTNLQVIIFGLSLVSVLVYLIVVNRTNTMGIEIGEMQLTINRLNDQYRDLQNQATSLQSMQRIEQISSNELSMVQATTYDYLLPESGSVAVAED